MFETLTEMVGLVAALALVRLGGALYEYSVVDPFWPQRPELIQPARGGVSRKRFWIPAQTAFDIALVATLVAAWPHPAVRTALLVALASHAAMRLWSAFDLIPKALAFEHADPAAVTVAAARAWTRRSLLRLPLDLVTCGATLVALVAAARAGG